MDSSDVVNQQVNNRVKCSGPEEQIRRTAGFVNVGLAYPHSIGSARLAPPPGTVVRLPAPGEVSSVIGAGSRRTRLPAKVGRSRAARWG